MDYEKEIKCVNQLCMDILAAQKIIGLEKYWQFEAIVKTSKEEQYNAPPPSFFKDNLLKIWHLTFFFNQYKCLSDELNSACIHTRTQDTTLVENGANYDKGS